MIHATLRVCIDRVGLTTAKEIARRRRLPSKPAGKGELPGGQAGRRADATASALLAAAAIFLLSLAIMQIVIILVIIISYFLNTTQLNIL